MRRASQSWGSSRQGCFLQLQFESPLQHGAELLIQSFHARLSQQMRPTLGPLHLLLLAEALADHLMHSRLHTLDTNALAAAVALAIIGDAIEVWNAPWPSERV